MMIHLLEKSPPIAPTTLDSSDSQKKRRRRLQEDVHMYMGFSSTTTSTSTSTSTFPTVVTKTAEEHDWLLVREPLFNGTCGDRSTVFTYLHIQECGSLAATCRYIAYCQRVRLQQFLNITNNGITILNHAHWYSTLSSSSLSPTSTLSLSSIQLSLDHLGYCICKDSGLLKRVLQQRKWKTNEDDRVFATSISKPTYQPTYQNDYPYNNGSKLFRLSSSEKMIIEIQPSHVPTFVWVIFTDIELCRIIIKENNKFKGPYSHNTFTVDDFELTKIFKRTCKDKYNEIVILLEAWEKMCYRLSGDFIVICGNDDNDNDETDTLKNTHIRMRIDFHYGYNCREESYLNFLVFLTRTYPFGMLQLLFPKNIPVWFPKHRSLTAVDDVVDGLATKVNSVVGNWSFQTWYDKKWNEKMLYKKKWNGMKFEPRSSCRYNWIFIMDSFSDSTLIRYLSIKDICRLAQVCKKTSQSHRSCVQVFQNMTVNGESILFDHHRQYPPRPPIPTTIILLIDDHIQFCMNNVDVFKRLVRQRQLISLSTGTEYITTSSREHSQISNTELCTDDLIMVLIHDAPAPAHILIDIFSSEKTKELYTVIINECDRLTMFDRPEKIKAKYTATFIELLKSKCQQFLQFQIAELISQWQQLMLTSDTRRYNITVNYDDQGLYIRLNFDLDNWRSDSYLTFLFHLTKMDLFSMIGCLFSEELSNVVLPVHRSISVSKIWDTSLSLPLAS
jgi:hypothetical protein